MKAEDCTVGRLVWYEPSYGVRFLARISSEPRLLGSSCVVVRLDMPSAAYGMWRGDPVRKSVPAASIECIFQDHDASEPTP